MANVTVVGAQWGDEGKGKLVDWLSARADVVVRFQGGHNAGHTLVVGNQVYKLSLLPSGVVQGKLSVIGNGVVVDPWALLAEIERVRGQGVAINPDVLVLADNAALILPLHRDLDVAREAEAIAQDRHHRARHRPGLRGQGRPPRDPRRRPRRPRGAGGQDRPPAGPPRAAAPRPRPAGGRAPDEILASLEAVAPKILPYAKPAWRLLDEAVKGGQRVLFEGAQGALLDVDHGTYPYVTSSNTVAGQAAAGSGLGPKGPGYVLGIVKAYTTRVGEGPFPTELIDEVGRHLRRGRPGGGHRHRPRRAAAAGSTRCWRASRWRSTASTASR